MRHNFCDTCHSVRSSDRITEMAGTVDLGVFSWRSVLPFFLGKPKGAHRFVRSPQTRHPHFGFYERAAKAAEVLERAAAGAVGADPDVAPQHHGRPSQAIGGFLGEQSSGAGPFSQ